MSGDYKAGGKVHLILDRLAEGSAHRGELAEMIRGPHQTPRRAHTRLYLLSRFLIDEGLVSTSPGRLTITPRGMEVLAELGPMTPRARSDHARRGAPNVRIFTRKEAA